jgi:hypothetical protein
MRRTSVFVALAFLAGLGLGYYARSIGLGTPHRTDAHAADMAAIEKLHQKDIEVTLSQDPKGLLDIWTEDAVRFNPGTRLRSASKLFRLKMTQPALNFRVSRC